MDRESRAKEAMLGLAATAIILLVFAVIAIAIGSRWVLLIGVVLSILTPMAVRWYRDDGRPRPPEEPL